MPEMRFVVAWPDGREDRCYSPSLVVQDYLEVGQSYPLADFVSRSHAALSIASDRVEAKFGHPCSLALGQLQSIEAAAKSFADQPDALVRCTQFIL